MRVAVSMGLLGLLAGLCGCEDSSRGSGGVERVIAQQTFDTIKDGRIPEGWWVEGGQKVGVEQGRLRIQANPAKGKPGSTCTVWTDIMLTGDARISYDAHVLGSACRANNLNFFLYYGDPTGQDLRETRDQRQSGQYALYHELNGYIVTFLNTRQGPDEPYTDEDTEGRIRIRRCPGFRLLKETSGYHCTRGRTYRIAMTRTGGTITCDVDHGRFTLRAEDASPLTEGRIAFRTWQTDYWVDNLKVVSLDR